MKTIIVGAGAISYCHAAALDKLGIEIYGIYDINEESASQLALTCHSKVIKNYEKAVHQVDMVHLCTPPSFRIPYAKTAMEAGCHVIMEKPMSISIDDAEQLVGLAHQHHVQLMVDFNHRFRNGFTQLLDTVRSGVIGEPMNIFIQRLGMLGGNAGTKNDTWRRNKSTVCGMTIESLAHDIDMIVQITGKIERVKSEVTGTFEDLPEFDTNVNVSFKTVNNVIGSLNASWSSHIKRSSRGVVGTKGTVILDGNDLFDYKTLRIKTNEMKHEAVHELNDLYHFETCPSYYNINKYMIEAIKNKKTSSVSGEYALDTLKVSHAILQSNKENRSISLM